MPLYEYDCQRCGTFEVKQKMSDEPLTTHAECGEPVVRKISLTSFALKGGGWYSDGYASTGAKSTAAAAPACSTGGCAGGSCAN
ncbi:MAG: FmdB family zinc ribbon protein [Myxococcota bacterium]